MLVCDYIVERIDGDYAMLKRTNLPEEEAKMVARALLPEEIREVAILFFFQEWKQREIAEQLQITLSLVKYRIGRARELLQKELEDQEVMMK